MSKKLAKILPWVVLLGGIFFQIFFMWNHVDHLIDSDMSSEMVLGRLLAKENTIISKNWYYATELRVINTQLIFPFFPDF